MLPRPRCVTSPTLAFVYSLVSPDRPQHPQPPRPLPRRVMRNSSRRRPHAARIPLILSVHRRSGNIGQLDVLLLCPRFIRRRGLAQLVQSLDGLLAPPHAPPPSRSSVPPRLQILAGPMGRVGAAIGVGGGGRAAGGAAAAELEESSGYSD